MYLMWNNEEWVNVCKRERGCVCAGSIGFIRIKV